MAETSELLNKLNLKIEPTRTDTGEPAYNVYDTIKKAPDLYLLARYKIDRNGLPIGKYYDKNNPDKREPLISAYVHALSARVINPEQAE